MVEGMALLAEYITFRKFELTDQRNRLLAEDLQFTLEAQSQGKSEFILRASISIASDLMVCCACMHRGQPHQEDSC